MATIVEATSSLATMNKRLSMALPIIESVQLLMESAPKFVEMGQYEMASSAIKTATELMALANEVLQDSLTD